MTKVGPIPWSVVHRISMYSCYDEICSIISDVYVQYKDIVICWFCMYFSRLMADVDMYVKCWCVRSRSGVLVVNRWQLQCDILSHILVCDQGEFVQWQYVRFACGRSWVWFPYSPFHFCFLFHQHPICLLNIFLQPCSHYNASSNVKHTSPVIL